MRPILDRDTAIPFCDGDHANRATQTVRLPDTGPASWPRSRTQACSSVFASEDREPRSRSADLRRSPTTCSVISCIVEYQSQDGHPMSPLNSRTLARRSIAICCKSPATTTTTVQKLAPGTNRNFHRDGIAAERSCFRRVPFTKACCSLWARSSTCYRCAIRTSRFLLSFPRLPDIGIVDI